MVCILVVHILGKYKLILFCHWSRFLCKMMLWNQSLPSGSRIYIWIICLHAICRCTVNISKANTCTYMYLFWIHRSYRNLPESMVFLDMFKCRKLELTWTVCFCNAMLGLGLGLGLLLTKLLVSLWVQTVRPLSRICFCTAMKEISC